MRRRVEACSATLRVYARARTARVAYPFRSPSIPKAMAASSPDLLLVLDFEATCDAPEQLRRQEIIEFPVLAVDRQTLQVISEYHVYVKPAINPTLTPFCTELTGITQPLVDAGVPLETALHNCCDWLKSLGVDPNRTMPFPNTDSLLTATDGTSQAQGLNKTAVLVTCGDWDMKHLRSETKAKGIKSAPIFDAWVNIKVPFLAATGSRGHGMMSMLDRLGIQHEGWHHSGIDDCRNIAKLLCTLVQHYNISTHTTACIDATGAVRRLPRVLIPS